MGGGRGVRLDSMDGARLIASLHGIDAFPLSVSLSLSVNIIYTHIYLYMHIYRSRCDTLVQTVASGRDAVVCPGLGVYMGAVVLDAERLHPDLLASQQTSSLFIFPSYRGWGWGGARRGGAGGGAWGSQYYLG